MAEPVLPESIVDGMVNHEPHHEALHAFHNTFINPDTGDLYSPDDFGANSVGATGPTGPSGANIWLNVKTYGAVGNNSTNDSAAVQAAFDAASPGSCVYFPRGNYRLVAGITCATQGVHVLGEGGNTYNESAPYDGAVLVGATAGMTILSLDHPTTVAHSGPRIEGLGFVDTIGQSMTGLKIKRFNYWTVRDCSFRDSLIGFLVDGDASDIGGTGTIAGGDSSWGLVEQCQWRNNATALSSLNSSGFLALGSRVIISSDSAVGFDLVGHYQHRLEGMKFDGGGIQVRATGAGTSIIGCQFESARTSSVELDGINALGDMGRFHKVIGCQFTADPFLTTAAIRLKSGLRTPPLLVGNTFTNNGFTDIIDESTIGCRRVADDKGTFQLQRTVAQTNVITQLDVFYETVLCDWTNATIFSIRLPSPTVGSSGNTSLKGRRFTFRKVDATANQVVILPRASETIDGASSYTLFERYESVTFECDGTNWSTVGRSRPEPAGHTQIGQQLDARYLGTLLGKAPIYTFGVLSGWAPIYDRITGISQGLLLGTQANNQSGLTTHTKNNLTCPAGDWIIIGGGYLGSSTATVTVTDSKGNTYTVHRQDNKTTGSTAHSWVASAKLTTALGGSVDSLTVTYSSAVNNPAFQIYRYYGLVASSYFDTANGGTGVASSGITSGSLTTAAVHELLFAAVYYDFHTTLTPGSGYAVKSTSDVSTTFLTVETKIGETAGAYVADGTGNATGNDWAITVAAFKESTT